MDYTLEQTAQTGGVTLFEVAYAAGRVQGTAIAIPGTPHSILTLAGRRGMLLCRLFDAAVAERLEMPAAIFSARGMEDMLQNKPYALTRQAVELGATPGMTGFELLVLFDRAE